MVRIIALVAAHVSTLLATLFVTAFVTPLEAQQPSGTTPILISAGKTVVPDTVEVGDPFALVVSVAAPKGARIEWPVIADTAGDVVMRSPVKISERGETATGHVERAQYDLTAWNIGTIAIGLGDILVHTSDEVRRVSLSDARVVVRSVLPGDTTLHVPKPPRDLFPRVTPWWMRWWPALLVVATLGLLWWLARRRKESRLQVDVPLPDVYDWAIKEFDRLNKTGLLKAGETGRHAIVAIDIMRWYLDRKLGRELLSLTSSELLYHVMSDTRIQYGTLETVLAQADEIKFARRSVSADTSAQLALDARKVVEVFETRERELRAAQEAAINAARAQAIAGERKAKEDAEEAARRASRKQRSGVG